MTYFKRFLIIAILSLTGFAFSSLKLHAATINPPAISEVNRGVENTLVKPMITGTTDPETEVLIYVDGSYVGEGSISAYGQRDNFYFQATESLTEGSHSVMAIARDNFSRVLSAPSQSVSFIVPPSDYSYETTVSEENTEAASIESAAISAPTLIRPNENTVTSNQKEKIAGLTQSGTRVLVYIDGNLDGKTKVITHSSGTGAFYYQPAKKLSRGEHKVQAIAENTDGEESLASEAMSFTIEYPMPAPTLIKAVVNAKTVSTRPFIAGVAKNNSSVNVYIDKKLDGRFEVENDSSGTANFAYQPSMNLSKKTTHRIYTTATDTRGKESIRSNSIYYTYPRTTSTGKIDGTAKISSTPTNTLSAATSTPKEETEKPASSPKESNLSNILNQDKGQVSEKVSSSTIWTTIQSKISLNLIIFLVFLVGVIGWIAWVNRELAKERKEREAGLAESQLPEPDKRSENPYDIFGPHKNI
ncbi:MAG: hypothetical protein WCW77_01705 [Patescibacteria group bacterium]